MNLLLYRIFYGCYEWLIGIGIQLQVNVNRRCYFCSLLFLLYFVCELWMFRDDIRQKMMTKYVTNPEYNFEKVNRASQACGPLVKWAIAQVCLNTLFENEFCL